MCIYLEFSGFFCNTEPYPITRQVFASLDLPLPEIDTPTTIDHSPPVNLVDLQSQSSSILPDNLQKLLNALSVHSDSHTQQTVNEVASSLPIAHQTYNAEYICSHHRTGRHGMYRDRTNCSIFYFCEGDDSTSLRYHIFFCPPGLEFSMDTCTCDWPTGRSCQTTRDIFCATKPATTSTTTTTTASTIRNYLQQSQTNLLGGLGHLMGISGGSTSLFDCTGKQSGLYRDRYDCMKFFFCTTHSPTSNGALLRYDFMCPTNYAFSMVTCRCELERNRNCRPLVKTDCLLL
jgi:hypothetical protein